MRSRRQQQLVRILAERKEWMKSKQLAELLGVSDRTIRSDVEAVNREAGFTVIESHVRQGYRVLESVEDLGERTVKQESDIPQTPGARCIYIIQKLLFEVKELNLTILQGQIYVSGYSIDNDIRRIRKMLEPYPGLKLLRTKECISLSGEEFQKRRFYKDLLVAEVQEDFLNLNRLANLYKGFDLLEVKDIFIKVLEQFGYSIHESMFPMLILHTGTSIERMRHSNYMNGSDKLDGLEETVEYQIAEAFFQQVSSRLHIETRKEEVSLLALCIMGRRASNYAGEFISYHGTWYSIKGIVEEALTRLWETYGMDFRGDEDLIAGLKMHLYGLIERLKNGVVPENMFLEEIKRKYPLVFEMGITITEFLREKLGAAIADVESGFLALHIGAASERKNSNYRYRAVMIVPHNQSFSLMCEKKISEIFKGRMEIVKVFNYFEEKAILKEEADFILTTFSLHHQLEILTIPIDLFVNSDTEARILQALNRLDNQRIHLEFSSHIGNLIRKEHYYSKLDAKTPEEVIQIMCRGLEQEGVVESKFQEVVLKREEMSPTSFVNAFAIPHAFGAFAKCSTIAIAQLRRPMKWGEFEVQLVMLFAINEGDQRMIKMFFDWVSSVVDQTGKLAELCVPCEYEQFLDRLFPSN